MIRVMSEHCVESVVLKVDRELDAVRCFGQHNREYSLCCNQFYMLNTNLL